MKIVSLTNLKNKFNAYIKMVKDCQVILVGAQGEPLAQFYPLYTVKDELTHSVRAKDILFNPPTANSPTLDFIRKHRIKTKSKFSVVKALTAERRIGR